MLDRAEPATDRTSPADGIAILRVNCVHCRALFLSIFTSGGISHPCCLRSGLHDRHARMEVFMFFDAVEMGNRIRRLRLQRGYSQEKLADELGITRRHIMRLESGKSAGSIDLIIEVANYFDVSLDYLALGKETLKEAKAELLKSIQDLQRFIENL